MSDIALITGGSRGIGKATALKMAQSGYDIVINYLKNQTAAEQTQREVEALGQRAIIVQADIAIEAEVERLFAAVDEQGTLAVLVNNAGVLETQSAFVDISLDRINRIFATNVMGTMSCCKQAVLRMSHARGGKGGVIINVSSGASLTGSPFEYVDYAASKGAIDTLTVGLAMEVAADGIRVNGVRPGLIYTDMHADGGEPGRVDRLKEILPLKRGGKPEDVAAAIAFLASDQASYSTGTFLNVTGGR